MSIKILFLCTGNSARSQMAEALANHDFAGSIEAFSAGTEPQGVNAFAIEAMGEVGIDISGNESKHLSQFQDQGFDHVITLCDDAKETCPFSREPRVSCIWAFQIRRRQPATGKRFYSSSARCATISGSSWPNFLIMNWR